MFTKSWLSRCWWMGMSCFLAIGGAIANWDCAFAQSQIVPDRTLGTEKSVVTPNFNNLPVEVITGGAIRGGNLFHSFEQFNVDARRGAYFINPAGIENILSRVTGGSRSEILGKLGVFGNANLFFLNPNGIIFGQNASLDIAGSFVASKENSFKFSNGSEFSATNPQTPSLLLAINVSPGLQSVSQGSITNAGGNLAVGQELILFLTNQYNLNTSLSSGDIQVVKIDTSKRDHNYDNASSSLVIIDSRGDIRLNITDKNSLTALPNNLIDTNHLIANSCIARSPQQKGSFIITGAGGLPTQPDDPANAPFPTYTVPTVGASTSLPSSVAGTNSPRLWKKGDPIVEPQGLYRLPSGQLVLSRECR